MKHLMIDIETLGNKSFSVITSIGAVEFNIETGDVGSEFYKRVSIESCLSYGLNVNADTIRWWMKQSNDARKEISNYDGEHLSQVLFDFCKFFDNDLFDGIQVWGNSNRFDLGLLENAFSVCKIGIPWNFRNERDVRTLVSFAPEIKDNWKWEGVFHNGLDDCKNQIGYCSAIWNKIMSKQLA